MEDEELVLEPPDVTKFTDGQWRAYQMITRHLRNTSTEKKQLLMAVFGTAGTGKSYLIDAVHYALRRGQTDHCRIVATTGLAAHNIHGRTVHSDLCLPITSAQKCDLKGNRLIELQKRLNPEVVRYIIIDEISMVSAGLLQVLEHFLSHFHCLLLRQSNIFENKKDFWNLCSSTCFRTF